ncbi:hypothetical protein PTTG_07766 [Puccinia triticina 1-1 BBBD Race 1]|uniref:NAM-associated domain-containing protein n=1 Tax=Puccinia triticina (isolate 1-1 / race 1 (BBBD)) TaxID=630390 RepID=A0A180H2A3_PUCT1|nr:hypothetical protein PTTG_07766 [Puccinia triticina 1-1 BBBD Race 1]
MDDTVSTATRSSTKKKKKTKAAKSTPKHQPNDVDTPTPAENPLINIENTPKTDDKTAPKKGFPRWSVEEDKKLCISWLNTSRDAIVGRGQKATTFWERIHDHLADLIKEYNKSQKHVKNFKDLPVRPVGAVECRWALILKNVNKFAGCYSTTKRRLKSGKTREDLLTEAKELYKATSGSTFNLDHCWGILKDTPKWQATQQENEAQGKKAKQSTTAPPADVPSSTPAASSPTVIDLDDDKSDASRSVLGNVQMEGSKAAKRKRAEDVSLGKMMTMQRELVTIACDRLNSMKYASEMALEETIMAKDLDSITDKTRRAYYAKKQKLIMERELKEEKEKKEKEEKEKKEKEENKKKEREEKEKREREEADMEEESEEEDEDSEDTE